MVTENEAYGKFTTAEMARKLVAESQERLFKNLLEKIDDGIWRAATDGKYNKSFDFAGIDCSDDTLARIIFEVKKNGHSVIYRNKVLIVSWEE